MRFIIFLFILLILSNKLISQPGGGGGLKIGGFYNQKLEKIDILNDSLIHIRSFLLTDDYFIDQETYEQQETIENSKLYSRPDKKYIRFELRPKNDYGYYQYSRDGSNQRLLIFYDNDTMLIDFIGIMNENGMGMSDYLDSIVVKTGYYKYNRNLNNANIPSKTSNSIDLSFLDENNLNSHYYVKKTAYHIRYKQANLALKALGKAIEKNSGVTNCEINFLLCDAYQLEKQYQKAVDALSNAMDCKRYTWDSEHDNYEDRIYLYTKIGQYNNAVIDFDELVKSPENSSFYNAQRAAYKMIYLNDYEGAKVDLKKDIDQIPKDHLRDSYMGYSKYYNSFFQLGVAEYVLNNQKKAFEYWLQSMEFAYHKAYTDTFINHFDSIISQNSQLSILYVLRGIAYYR